MTRTLLLSCVLLAACQGGSDGGRMAAKVVEIDRTVQTGSSTTIDRTTIAYEGARMVKVGGTLNGTPNGTANVTYGKNGIERIEYIDKEGDRGIDTLTHTDGRLTKERYEIPGVLVDELVYAYHAERPDLLKEVTNTVLPVNGLSSTRRVKYEYDAEERLARQTFESGMTSSMWEYRYNADGLVDRMTAFSGATVTETYTFRYTMDGKLDEVMDSNNNRHELTYDEKGRVIEIRLLSGTTTTTTRYTYAAGNVEGWTFAPAVPGGHLFDMAGEGFPVVEMMHGAISVGADIPKPL